MGLARIGAENQIIQTGTLRQLALSDLGGPLHSFIVTGHLHPLEVDMLRLFALPDSLTNLKMIDSSTYFS